MANNRRNPKAKWVLPEVVNPEDRRCFTIPVPDDPQHIAAFRGALLNLCSAMNWQDDTEHTAKDVAAVWRTIYEEVEACIMAVTDVRQNEELPCILEKQIDEGEYVEFANLQLCPPRIRTNEGKLQWWDGTQWVDVPGEGDERFEGEYDPPFPDPPTGETGNCLAAENLTALLQQQVTEWSTALNAGAIALGIVTIITGVLTAFFIPWATVAVLGFATTLIGLGASGIDAAFTSTVYDRFKCIINCHAASDGSITVAEYDEIIEEIQAESGVAWDLIEVWIGFFGNVGLNRAATSAGITDGDCSECDCGWCYALDLATDTGWTLNPGTQTANGFETTLFNGGGGYMARAFSGSTDFTSFNCTEIELNFTYNEGIRAGTGDSALYFRINGSNVLANILVPTIPDTPHIITGNFTITNIFYQLLAGVVQNGTDPGGSAVAPTIIFRGNGTNPFGSSNCEP